ncbi:MAG TPA: VOC family protein [Burkholderiaceae bacterium]|nr:VOC family protein [Burkholderiaceae bacterium]
MLVKKLHHVAYRCKDAQETADFYSRVLHMPLWHAIVGTRAHGKDCPFIHIFHLLEDGSSLAFFELPESPQQEMDPNTPSWVQHIAFEVDSIEALHAAQLHLESVGVEVLGPKEGNSTLQSIYFFDPNGHRLELCVNRGLDPTSTTSEATEMLRRWNASKAPVARAASSMPASN